MVERNLPTSGGHGTLRRGSWDSWANRTGPPQSPARKDKRGVKHLARTANPTLAGVYEWNPPPEREREILAEFGVDS